jgi:hypothetical protein
MAMAKVKGVPVTMRAVIQRINRKLLADDEVLRKARGERARQEVGEFYVINFSMNSVMSKYVDPEEMARELGVLQPWETVTE